MNNKRSQFLKKDYIIHKFSSKGLEEINSAVIGEEEISFSVNGKIWLTFLCSPIDLKELALGFLYNENVITSMSDIREVFIYPEKNLIDVWLSIDVEEPLNWRITSGCGGGRTSISEIDNKILTKIYPVISGKSIVNISSKLYSFQGLYQEVRGVHAAAISDSNQIVYLSEDIGRHNAVDKVIGKYLIADNKITPLIMITSGRVSSEMIQKAININAEIVISRTSPTTKSIEIADKFGVTLIGYSRGSRFNVYTHPNRIIIPE